MEQAQNGISKETFKIVEFPQRIKINRPNSKETLCNDQAKGKNNSKLPRIIARSPTKFNKPIKSPSRQSTKLDDSVDSLPGPSTLTNIPAKRRKEYSPEKLKSSHIPRRKCIREGSKESCNSTTKTQDFCPEEHAQPASVASTRPIPTLGQIYGRIDMIESDRLNDWFLELNTPLNSSTSHPRNLDFEVPSVDNDCVSSTEAAPATCHQEATKKSTIVLNRKENLIHGFKTPNEINVCLTSDVEFPTKKNESGYCTMSLNTAQKSKQMKPVGQSIKSNSTFCFGMTMCPPNKKQTQGPSVECNTDNNNSLLKKQPTVTIRKPTSVMMSKQKIQEGTDNTSKLKVSMKPTSIIKLECNNSYQYPSNVHHAAAVENNRISVPSYTACLSEILQKTTNFENIEGTMPTTTSSVVVTDIHDNLSTEDPIDAMDEFDGVEDQTNMEWCRQKCNSNCNMTFANSDSTGTDWSCRCRSEVSETLRARSSDHHPHTWNLQQEVKKYYSESHNIENRDHCKKNHRFKRFPSSRYKLPNTFGSWRRRISLRRLCRRRWNHVWKKTTERWATWSTRSPTKFKRFRVMHYLQRSIIWEDADAQTNILVYNEAGTDSVARELKSAAIDTIFNMETWQALCKNSESGSQTLSLNRSKYKQVNLGPSMFSFLYNTKKKASSLHGVDKVQSSLKTQSSKKMTETFWNTDQGMDACNSVKSCQYEGAIPTNVERSTSLFQVYNTEVVDELTDTEGLPNSMCDNVTSTMLRYSKYRLYDTASKDMDTQKIVTGQNAETDVTFLPNSGNTSTGGLISDWDITYYKPLTDIDITHLIAETKTDQENPIVRKYNPNATSSSVKNKSAERETQIGTYAAVKTIATDMPSFNRTFAEKTTSYSHGSIGMRYVVEKEDRECQVEEPKPISTGSIGMRYVVEKQDRECQVEEPKPISTESETQMTPYTSTSVVSTGVTPSCGVFGEKASTVISACLLVDNDMERDNYATQTQSPKPKLAFTDTNITSISSRQLLKEDTSNTEITSHKPLLTNNAFDGSGTVNCLCKLNEVTSRGTEMKTCLCNCNRATSSCFFQTEILLNSLIKKALTGDVAVSHHSQYSDRLSTNRISSMSETTGTNTNVGVHSKSIGPTTSEFHKLIGSHNRTDTGVQYIELQGKQEPLIYKCASVMTIYCGLEESIQVPGSTINTLLSEKSDKALYTFSVLSCDTQTNTEYRSLPNLGQPTQTSTLRPQRNIEVNSFTTSLNTAMNSKAELKNNLNYQLISLSSLIGKRRKSPTITPPVATPIFSSDITADKWIKKCSSMENTYESMVGLRSSDTGDTKKNSLLDLTKSESGDTNRGVLVGPPILILSKDSLADVLPVKKSTNFYIKKMDAPINYLPLMVDEETSDENITKDVKESVLQACPDTCETGTESQLQIYQRKSECVMTTHCILPLPLPCSGITAYINSQHQTDCLFVYGEPRCAIHRISADAGVQLDPPTEKEVNPKKVNHSVSMLTSYCAVPEGIPRKRNMTRELLSPKVYKALYETTKLVVSQDANQHPVKDSVTTCVDAEVSAAKTHMPNLRSAGVVTSSRPEFGLVPTRCYCQAGKCHSKKNALYQLGKDEATEKSSQHTNSKLFNMPDENKEGCSEDCVKTHLVTSCRYYSNLLTKQLGRVKDNLTKHLVQPIEDNVQVCRIRDLRSNEVCTMKPSGKTELACQTLRYKHYYKSTVSCCFLTPAMSLTDICKHDKDHLKSVYYMLTAIEGRLRRLKLGTPNINFENCHNLSLL